MRRVEGLALELELGLELELELWSELGLGSRLEVGLTEELELRRGWEWEVASVLGASKGVTEGRQVGLGCRRVWKRGRKG